MIKEKNSETLGRKEKKQKQKAKLCINEDTEGLNNTINQQDLTDIYKILYQE